MKNVVLNKTPWKYISYYRRCFDKKKKSLIAKLIHTVRCTCYFLNEWKILEFPLFCKFEHVNNPSNAVEARKPSNVLRNLLRLTHFYTQKAKKSLGTDEGKRLVELYAIQIGSHTWVWHVTTVSLRICPTVKTARYELDHPRSYMWHAACGFFSMPPFIVDRFIRALIWNREWKWGRLSEEEVLFRR